MDSQNLLFEIKLRIYFKPETLLPQHRGRLRYEEGWHGTNPQKQKTIAQKGIKMPLKIGQKAPQFSLPNEKGEKVALKEFKGKKVILYFYPKDMTPGCTTEACDFRDALRKIKRRGAVVLGVSKDSSERHQKFIDKYGLNFPLLSDEEGKVCEKYDVWQEKKLYGKVFMGIVRTTVIIDEDGKIEQLYHKVKVKGHVDQVLEEI